MPKPTPTTPPSRRPPLTAGWRASPRRAVLFAVLFVLIAVPAVAMAWWPEALVEAAVGVSVGSWGLWIFVPLTVALTGGCWSLRATNGRLREVLAEVTSDRDRCLDSARRHEAALRQSSVESEALIALVRREKAALEESARTVSHDLRGSLTAIKGFAKLLMRDVRIGDEKRISDDVDQILEAADKMVMKLDDLKRIRRSEVSWARTLPSTSEPQVESPPLGLH